MFPPLSHPPPPPPQKKMFLWGYATVLLKSTDPKLFLSEPAKNYGRPLQELSCFFRYNNFLYLSAKKSEICVFCAIWCDRGGLNKWLDCISVWPDNLTRFYFSVLYAVFIKIYIYKKLKKLLPTYLNFFEHLTPKYIYIFFGLTTRERRTIEVWDKK